MKDLIACIAKAIVDNPEIGKHGRTVVAIRTILSAASMKLKKRCIIDLLE
ncbi:MAG: KH domain-containing protein [Desulfatiglandales bacterium]